MQTSMLAHPSLLSCCSLPGEAMDPSTQAYAKRPPHAKETPSPWKLDRNNTTKGLQKWTQKPAFGASRPQHSAATARINIA